MFEFNYRNSFATINGIEYEVNHYELSAPNSVSMFLKNETYNWGTTAVANETTINGVIQTSVQMIIDTLSNGQS